MKKLAFALVAALSLLAGLLAPVTTASAVELVQGRQGCIGEHFIQKKPGIAPPFRSGGSIHFGYAEWHNSPSCKDDLRRAWVKVYKVQKGTDPRVYFTKGDREIKSFPRGAYRVKVRYQYRYWNASSRTFGKWHNITKTKTIRIG